MERFRREAWRVSRIVRLGAFGSSLTSAVPDYRYSINHAYDGANRYIYHHVHVSGSHFPSLRPSFKLTTPRTGVRPDLPSLRGSVTLTTLFYLLN